MDDQPTWINPLCIYVGLCTGEQEKSRPWIHGLAPSTSCGVSGMLPRHGSCPFLGLPCPSEFRLLPKPHGINTNMHVTSRKEGGKRLLFVTQIALVE